MSPILILPSQRPGRRTRASPLDPNPDTFFGDAIIQKQKGTTRIFFQNVKGLSSSTLGEDYRYYLSCMKAYEIDIAGLAETNTCWSHPHLRSDFCSILRRQYLQSKVTFGSPSKTIDPCPTTETFQSGGSLTLVTDSMVSCVNGEIDLVDNTGLGRWSGVSFMGRDNTRLTIITAYRVCSGSPRTAPLGSAFLREYNHFLTQNKGHNNPRREFLIDLQSQIQRLQASGHMIILMMDANATMETDSGFDSFLRTCNLVDLHQHSPAPSTYIGAASRRIDFMFGCLSVQQYVTRSGTLSYYEGPQSDHRGMYIDVCVNELFHHNSSKILPPSQRSLHTGNPEHVIKYHASMLRYYHQHNMIQRISQLYQTHHGKSRSEVRELLTKWDNDQGRAMELSERILRKPPKKYRWSPELRNSAIIRRYWKLRLREATNMQLNYTESFLRWQQQVQAHDPSFTFPHLEDSLSVETIREHLNRATRAFRKRQKSSESLRMQSIQELLEIYEDDSNPATIAESQRKAKIVKKTISSETCRGTFTTIRNVLKPSERSGISKLTIPRSKGATNNNDEEIYQLLQTSDPDDLIWETVINREELERHLLTYNRCSFRAASESPCGHGVIHDALTFSSLSPISLNLLHGEIPNNWCGDDAALKEFLASFAIPECVRSTPPIEFEISEDNVVNGFRKWPESTSTSPSGRHLGHYKAIIQNRELLRCLVQFLNIAISRGIAIPRWCQATNVLIEKDPGRPRIHRLRIIHLFEADFNFFLKLQWGHRLVRKAWELNILHPGQHGSVPNRTAMDPVMLTELTTDLCRVLKHDLARFDNDASACYDRIIVALGMLAARRCGMPDNAIRVHAEALQFMQYTVKTVYGISKNNYHGTAFEPLFGTGQGSGASPSVWLTLVVILLHTLDRLVPDRMNFAPFQGDRHHQRLVDAFVDDTSMGFTSPGDHTYEELIVRLQNVAQTWEHLLYLSGGKLNLSKCSWYVMYWEWDKGRPKLREITPADPTIRLHHGSQESTTVIRRTSVDESTRMLGVYLNPMGDFGHHIKILRQKADGYASRLSASRLTAQDIRIFHRSIYVPAMRYSLAALSVDEEALSGVQTNILKVMLQKMHVSGNLPTSIRHGPIEMGGLGMYDLRTEAGIEAIKFLRNSVYTDSEAGNLIRINLQYSQLESGIGEPLLEYPAIHVPYLTPTWVLSVRQFLSCHNMTITLSETYSPKLQTTSDGFIMQRQHLERYTAGQQRDINLVRLHLQVTTLADLVDPHSASAISLSALDGTRSQSWVNDPRWPRQDTPTPTQRRLWKRFICSSYLRYVPFWKISPLLSHSLSTDASAESSPTSFASLTEYVRTLPNTQRRLLADLQQQASDVQVWRAFRSKAKLYIASDGGLDGNRGTHGWVLASKKHVLFRCSGPVDGFVSTESSTRSELAGCASSLLLITIISRMWGLRHRCSFCWITDSRAAISRITRYVLPGGRCIKQMPDDADLISLIATLYRELRRPFRPEWVKGHQDSLQSYEHLPFKARLNIDADFLATRYRLRGRLKSSPLVDHQIGQKVSILINGKRLTSQFDSCIRYHINGYHLRRYMQERHAWSDCTWEDIDFHLFGQHFKRLPPHLQVTHMKRVHGQLPLGTRRYEQSRIKEPTLKLCPCCKLHEETADHLLRCIENPVHATSLQQLRRDLLTGDIHPARYLIMEGIEFWTTSSQQFSPTVHQYPVHLGDHIAAALESQGRIGWQEATSGLLSKQWSVLSCLDMHSPNRTNIDAGMKRMKSFMTAIHAHTTRLWMARNEVLHSTQDGEQANIRSSEAAEIRSLHQQPHLLRAGDRHYCERSLERLLQGSSSMRRRWLRRVRQSIAEHQSDGGRQSLITTYFASTTG